MHAPTHLAHGLRNPEPAAALGQAHSSLQAYLVAHGDIEGLAAVVVALQGLGQGKQSQSTAETSPGGFRTDNRSGAGCGEYSPEVPSAQPGPEGQGLVHLNNCTRVCGYHLRGVQAPGHSPCPGQSQSLLSEEMSLLQPAEVVSGKQEEKTWTKSFLVEGRGQACLFLESKQPLGKERAGPTSAHGLQPLRRHAASWPRAQPSHVRA